MSEDDRMEEAWEGEPSDGLLTVLPETLLAVEARIRRFVAGPTETEAESIIKKLDEIKRGERKAVSAKFDGRQTANLAYMIARESVFEDEGRLKLAVEAIDEFVGDSWSQAARVYFLKYRTTRSKAFEMLGKKLYRHSDKEAKRDEKAAIRPYLKYFLGANMGPFAESILSKRNVSAFLKETGLTLSPGGKPLLEEEEFFFGGFMREVCLGYLGGQLGGRASLEPKLRLLETVRMYGLHHRGHEHGAWFRPLLEETYQWALKQGLFEDIERLEDYRKKRLEAAVEGDKENYSLSPKVMAAVSERFERPRQAARLLKEREEKMAREAAREASPAPAGGQPAIPARAVEAPGREARPQAETAAQEEQQEAGFFARLIARVKRFFGL